MHRAGKLIERIADADNLRLAFWNASRGKQTKAVVLRFRANLDEEVRQLREQLLAGSLPWGPSSKFLIRDPKERMICEPSFRDQVAHHALLNITEPVFEAYQIHDSYACRKGKGVDGALTRARGFARHGGWFLKLDIRKYFDSIHHETLKAQLHRRFKDRAVLSLFEGVIDSYETTPGRGVPIGNLTDADEIELALDVCEAGRSAAQKSRQFALVKELAAKADDLKKQQASSQEYRKALAVMENDPAEPAANLAAGRYLCLVKGDWERGVPMLALGSDAALKAVALMELRGADSAEQQAAVGNAWWDAAETRQGTERDTLRLRAGVWYRQAEPKLTGSLTGLKIKQRQEQLAEFRLSDSALVERAGSLKERLVFQFNDQAFTEKYWDWNGQWEMTEDGGKAPPGDSFLRSRHAYLSDVIIDMDFGFGQAAFTNTGGCWITMWGKQLTISMDWHGLNAKVHIHREGNEIVYVLNGKEQRIAVEPQIGAKPTIIDLYWRSRTSHFRRIEIKADRMVPVNVDGTSPASKTEMGSRQSPNSAQLGRELAGLMGRARASGKDVGLVLRYQPGRIFPQQTFDDLLAKQGIPSRNIQIELGGVLRLDKTTSVLVTHKGGSSDRGVLHLYLNGRELGVVGDNHTKDTTYQVELPSGLHVIRWVLTGGAIGGGNMIQFVDSRTNQPLPVLVPAEAAVQVRSMPFKSEVDVSSN